MRHTGDQTEATLEARATTAFRIRTILLCFVAVVMDGYDTAAVGFASPSMAAEWNISPAAFTPAFVGTSIGAVIGFLLAGPLAQRWGQRLVMLLSLLWFGASSLMTMTADSIMSLTAWRFITAIGLGGAVPVAISLASEYSNKRYKELAATIVGMGFGLGVVIGGIVSKPLLATHPWTSIFLVGGLAPLVVFPLFWFWLPQSSVQGNRSAAPKPLLTQLLSPQLRRSTLFLWTFAFLIFMNTYMFTFWTPLLLSSLGFSAADAAIGPTAFGAGGLLGAILAMPAITRFGAIRVLVLTSLIGAGAVAVLGLAALDRQGILLMLAVAGAGMAFGNIGQGAAAVSIYATELRATGIGCAAAIGRVGSIIGPALAGALLYLNWPVQQVILTACIPSSLAALAMFALATTRRSTARDAAAPAKLNLDRGR